MNNRGVAYTEDNQKFNTVCKEVMNRGQMFF